METFRLIEKIGKGTFGEVYGLRYLVSGDYLAGKHVRVRQIRDKLKDLATREICALEEVTHPHVVRLFSLHSASGCVVYLFDVMKTDFDEVISNQHHVVHEHVAVRYFSMILKGVAYCHRKGIIHRDLKPSNIFVSSAGVLKIGDFGLARPYSEIIGTRTYTHQVATRWYRAPELLFGARRYDFAVDTWAIGVIFGELLKNSPMFPGENDLTQIYRVIQFFGKPSDSTWPGISLLPDYGKITFPAFNPISLTSFLCDMEPQAIKLMKNMLNLCPSKRISVNSALNSPFLFSVAATLRTKCSICQVKNKHFIMEMSKHFSNASMPNEF
jgi:cell cycle related kinase